MNKQPKSMSYFLAEDVRQEIGNKLTIVGLFPNDDMLFPKGTPVPINIQSLVIYVLFREGEGNFRVKSAILTEREEYVIIPAEGNVVMEAGRTMTLGLKLAPLSLPGFGKYLARIELDDKPYEFSFYVREENDGHSDVH